MAAGVPETFFLEKKVLLYGSFIRIDSGTDICSRRAMRMGVSHVSNLLPTAKLKWDELGGIAVNMSKKYLV